MFSDKTILVVDDSDMNNSVIKAILERYGANVLLAQNGADAVDQFKKSADFSICAILMDIVMPIMDGLQAAKEIRALDRADCKKIPIIAVTASVDSCDKKSLLDSGMTDFLSKPIDPELLLDAIGSHL